MTLSDGTEIRGVDSVNFRDTSLPPVEGRVLEEDSLQVTIHTAQGIETIQRTEVDNVDNGGGKYLSIDFGKWYLNSFFVSSNAALARTEVFSPAMP